MAEYRHTQKGTLLRRFFGVTIVALAIGAFFAAHESSSATVILAVVSAVLILTTYVFNSLTVEVSSSIVRIAFGPGWIRKRFQTSEITHAETVQNRWFYGWGIRYTPHGWLFNVSGFDAVQIELSNGKKYRIGTDEPEKLRDAIAGVIDPQHP